MVIIFNLCFNYFCSNIIICLLNFYFKIYGVVFSMQLIYYFFFFFTSIFFFFFFLPFSFLLVFVSPFPLPLQFQVLYLLFFFSFFGHMHGTWVLDHPCHCSDNASSLTCCSKMSHFYLLGPISAFSELKII